MTRNRDIVVIGASAGGLDPLRRIIAGLPRDFPASVYVVMHTASEGPGLLPEILRSVAALPVDFPADGDPVSAGRVCVAPPDHHLLLDPDRILILRGPKENRFRPAIDPLFRSAAVHHGPRVIGVLLSGMLDDGVSGLSAVRRCGGITIVQDPREATYPSMVENAMRAVDVHHCLEVDAIAPLLGRLSQETVNPAKPTMEPSDRLKIEADLAASRGDASERLSSLGKLSRLVCPECHGSLWEIEDEHVLRFRCHIGHAYSAECLSADQTHEMERAMMVALRTLEDTAALCHRLAEDAEKGNRLQSRAIYERRAKEAAANADVIRKIFEQQRKELRSDEGKPSALAPTGGRGAR